VEDELARTMRLSPTLSITLPCFGVAQHVGVIGDLVFNQILMESV